MCINNPWKNIHELQQTYQNSKERSPCQLTCALRSSVLSTRSSSLSPLSAIWSAQGHIYILFQLFQHTVDDTTQSYYSSSTSSNNWIVMSCQPHRVTSGQSNSGHKQIHISKFFWSIIYQPSVKSIYNTKWPTTSQT